MRLPGGVQVGLDTCSGGSRPSEIVKRYRLRQQELRDAGYGFVYPTDGAAWKSLTGSLTETVNGIGYVMNFTLTGEADFLKRMLLSE